MSEKSLAAPGTLPALHLLLALGIVAIWGTNFVIMHEGLAQFSAFTLATLRFAFASIPLLPFLRWPKAPARMIALYGLLIGVGQFGLMLTAMQGHISPGIASVIIQAQAFFTVAIAVLVNGERLTTTNVLGLCLCSAGIIAISLFAGGDADLLGILLVLGAALAWGTGNVVARRLGSVNPLGLVAWSNLFAVPPLAMAALAIDGPHKIIQSLVTADAGGWCAALWQSFGNALIGYGAWNWLLARHPASRIAPLGLLVPFFGLGASSLYLGEGLPAWKILAALTVVSGLAINISARRMPNR